MTRHWACRIGFRDIYASYRYGVEEWYEERCLLFKYKSVNMAWSDEKEVWIDRRKHRCCKCPYYPLCFRQEIIRSKYWNRRKELGEIYWYLEELNGCDWEETWDD